VWRGLRSRLLRRLDRDAIEYTGSTLVGHVILACDQCGALVDYLEQSAKEPFGWLCGPCKAREQECQETT
jgi:hypothetical protein